MLSLIPIPGYDRYFVIMCEDKDTVYLLSEFMLVFMCLRIYFLIRAMLNFTDCMDPFAKKICKAYGFDNNVLFTIKSYLAPTAKPEQTSFYIFFVSLILFAYIIRVFEMPRYRM